jgi:hypothetical protein
MREVRVGAEPGSEEQRELLLGEIRRTLSAARNQFHADVECAVMFGSPQESRELANRVQQQLQLEVDVVNPLEVAAPGSPLTTTVASPGRYAAGIGMLAELGSGRRQTIDFVNPRRPAEPPSATRRYAVPGAIAAAIVAFMLAGMWWRLSTLDSRIAELQQQVNESKPVLEKAQSRIAEVEAIEAWIKSDVHWLDELARISRDLPPPEQIRMEQVVCAIESDGDGQIELQGFSDSHESMKRMEQALIGESRTVRGDQTQFDGKDPRYQWRFKETVLLDNDVPLPKPVRRGPARIRSFYSF